MNQEKFLPKGNVASSKYTRELGNPVKRYVA
jgi:hypothetical protein